MVYQYLSNSMKLLIYLILPFIVACNSKARENNFKSDTQNAFSAQTKDTIIKYDLEGISTEGTEAKAKYSKNKIIECELNIYGETGQAQIIYKFTTDKIIVTQRDYIYNKQLDKIDSNEDIKLNSSLKYDIEYSGKIIGRKPDGIIEIFNEVKKQVPFALGK